MLKYEPDEIIAGRLKYFENRLFPLFWRLDRCFGVGLSDSLKTVFGAAKPLDS